MKTLRYDGPGHRLRLGSGELVPCGGEATVPAGEASRLVADPHIQVTVLPQKPLAKSARNAAAVTEPPADTGEGHHIDNDDKEKTP